MTPVTKYSDLGLHWFYTG